MHRASNRAGKTVAGKLFIGRLSDEEAAEVVDHTLKHGIVVQPARFSLYISGEEEVDLAEFERFEHDA